MQVPVCPCQHSFDSSLQRRNFEGGNRNLTLGSSLLKSQGSLLGDVCMNFLRKRWESNPALPHPKKILSLTSIQTGKDINISTCFVKKRKKYNKKKQKQKQQQKRQSLDYFQDETKRASTFEKEFQAADRNLPGELSETQLLLNGW